MISSCINDVVAFRLQLKQLCKTNGMFFLSNSALDRKCRCVAISHIIHHLNDNIAECLFCTYMHSCLKSGACKLFRETLNLCEGFLCLSDMHNLRSLAFIPFRVLSHQCVMNCFPALSTVVADQAL